MARKEKPLAVVICGGWGFGTLGLQKAGYRVAMAMDLSPLACENHRKLTGVKAIVADAMVADYRALCKKRGINPRKVRLVLVSPPCEGITPATGASRTSTNPLNRILERLPAILAKAFPNATIVTENVAGLLDDQMVSVFRKFRDNLLAAGRLVPTRREIRERFVLQAADYGIAQRRERVFIPAVPKGKKFPVYPAPTHSEHGKNGLPKWVSIGAALAGMKRDPDPRFPEFEDMEFACYLAREHGYTQRYIRDLQRVHRLRHGTKRKAKTFLRTIDPSKVLPCLTAKMRLPGRCACVLPSGKRFISIGEIMVAGFGMSEDSRRLIGSVEECWDALADAIVPLCAELVGRAVLGEKPPPAKPKGPTSRIIKGDALTELRNMPSNSVNMIVTSPPYFQVCHYGGGKREIGWERTVDTYVAKLVEVFREGRRVLEKDGLCFLNLCDCYGEGRSLDGQKVLRGAPRGCRVGVVDRLKLALMADGWILRQEVIWDKNCYRAGRKANRPKDTYESILMLSKTNKYYWQYTPETVKAVWQFPPRKGKSAHPCPFPEELPRRCIECGCPEGGLVLDPFAGSGTTLRVAEKMGRSAIGIDLAG